jgi:hypothetical protein
MKDLRLSTYVLTQIEALDIDYERDYPSDEDRRMLKLVRRIAESVLKSRESFTNEAIKEVEQIVQDSPHFVAEQLDDLLTRQLLLEVQGMVARIIKLSRLDADNRPSKDTAAYLQEAARTYVFGLTQASIAMSRRALEAAFKEPRWGRIFPDTMGDRIDEVIQYTGLDEATRAMAKSALSSSNKALHQRPASNEKAFEILVSVRCVLQCLYSARVPK